MPPSLLPSWSRVLPPQDTRDEVTCSLGRAPNQAAPREARPMPTAKHCQGCASRCSWRQRRTAGSEPTRAASLRAQAQRRCPPWLIGGGVERRRWDDPEVDRFLERREPVVLTGGCPLIRNVVDRWSFDYLAEGFGACDKLNVHFAPRETTAFARHYGRGLGKGGCTAMTFARFVSLVKSDYLEPAAAGRHIEDGPSSPPLRYYLQTPMVWNDADRDGANPHGLSEDSESAERPLAKAPYGPAVEADVRSLGWRWLARARTVADCHPFDTCQLWVRRCTGL